MKVIVAGSRSIHDYAYIVSTIESSPFMGKITEVVSGTAKGVDSAGEHWAMENSIAVKRFPVDWNVYGRKAGVIRNELMGEYADAAVLVWDGNSSETVHMLKTMRGLRKPYYLEAPTDAYSRVNETNHKLLRAVQLPEPAL